MITRTSQIASMIVAALLLAGGTAQADFHPPECTEESKLLTTLEELEYTNRSKDLPGLQSKIEQAFYKVNSEGKFCDGVGKLQDFQNKLRQLVHATKPKAVDPDYPTNLKCLVGGTSELIEDWQKIAADNGGCEDAGDPPRGNGPKNK